MDKFRKVLTHRAATEIKELATIYWEEASQRHSDAALLYTFSAAESAMRKARRYKQLPQAPQNVQDFDNILSNTNMFRIHSGSRRDPFYQTTLTLNDDSVCVIFMHMKTIETIGHIEEIHINDAMNTAPDIQLTHHLLIVHAVKNYYVRMLTFTYFTCIHNSNFIISCYLACSNFVCNISDKNASNLCGYLCLYSRKSIGIHYTKHNYE